ncbi:oligosaccharide flippase family protein [bacterium]|nr:oligosaccharide flippase family protein [bacterium]
MNIFWSNYLSKFKKLNSTKKNTVIYTATGYIESVIRFLQSFILAKILGPTLMGEVAAVTLIMTYGTYLQLGTYSAIIQKIPLFKASKEFEKAETYKNTAFTFSVFIGLLAFIGVSIYAIISQLSNFYRIGFILQGMCIPLYYIFLFYTGILRIENRFISSSILQLLQAFSILVVSLTTVFFISNKAILVAQVIAFMISIVYSYKNRIEWFKIQIDLGALKSLLIIGMPLITVDLFNVLLNTIDRVVIIRFLNETQLGLYTFPIGLAAFYFTASVKISQVIYRKVLFEFGVNQDEKNVTSKLLKSGLFLVLISPRIGFCIEGSAYFLIDNFLPQYFESRIIFHIIIPACIFMTVTPFLTSVLITLEKQLFILIVQFLLALIVFSIDFVLLKYLNKGINEISLVTILSYFLYFILLSFVVIKTTNSYTLRDFFKIVFKTTLIYLFTITIQTIGIYLSKHNIFFLLNYNFEGFLYLIITISLYLIFLFIIYKTKLLNNFINN